MNQTLIKQYFIVNNIGTETLEKQHFIINNIETTCWRHRTRTITHTKMQKDAGENGRTDAWKTPEMPVEDVGDANGADHSG